MTAPSFDLQVNGYAGVDFNAAELSLDDMRKACERLRADGVGGALATIITADLPSMSERLTRIARYREQDSLIREVIAGIHLEGPFLSPKPGFVGAHPPEHVRPADAEIMQRQLGSAGGLIRLVTLAPEEDAGFRVIEMLASSGVKIAAGHCDPSLSTLRDAITAGVTLFTHWGNGCPPMLPRHDNILQRVLSLSDSLWVTLIADGLHLPFFVLENCLKMIGVERAIVVTDAISAAGMGPGRYTIGSVEAVVGNDLVPRLASNPALFAGSALTMFQAAANLRERLQLNETQIDLLLNVNPRRALT